MHDSAPSLTRLRFRMVNHFIGCLRGKGRGKGDYT